MPTTVTHSIGTSARDYSTLQAWEDACPANLVTADQIWRGEAYNDSEFTWSAGTLLTISGQTTDSTRYVELTTASGQSFRDHVSVRTNPLGYDVSKGVGIRGTGTYGTAINTNKSYTRVSNFQFKRALLQAQSLVMNNATGQLAHDLVIEGGNVVLGGAMGYNLAISPNNNNSACRFYQGKVTLLASTLVSVGAAQTHVGISSDYSQSHIVQSCAIFGFTAAVDITSRFDATNSKYNATDNASGMPGTNVTYGISFSASAPFVNAASINTDLRAVNGGALAGLGFLDATNAPNDISGLARTNPPYAGAWEAGTVVPTTVETSTVYVLT